MVFHCVDYDKKRNESLGQIIIDLVNVDVDNGYMGNYQLTDLVRGTKSWSRSENQKLLILRKEKWTDKAEDIF